MSALRTFGSVVQVDREHGPMWITNDNGRYDLTPHADEAEVFPTRGDEDRADAELEARGWCGRLVPVVSKEDHDAALAAEGERAVRVAFKHCDDEAARFADEIAELQRKLAEAEARLGCDHRPASSLTRLAKSDSSCLRCGKRLLRTVDELDASLAREAKLVEREKELGDLLARSHSIIEMHLVGSAPTLLQEMAEALGWDASETKEAPR